MSDYDYISLKDTAKLVRAALADAFPGQTFSVRGRSYANGASIDVTWTDGPTTKEVDAVCKRFEGATFDGMIDLKSYVEHTVNGRKVHYAADYVMTQREHSFALLQRCAEAVAKEWGCEVARVWEETSTWRGQTYTSIRVDREGAQIDPYTFHSTAGDKTIALAHQTSCYELVTVEYVEGLDARPEPEQSEPDEVRDLVD